MKTVNNLKLNGHSLYHEVEHSAILFSAHTVYLCVFCGIWEQTAIISLYSIDWMVCITETECVYCPVRIVYVNIIQVKFIFREFDTPKKFKYISINIYMNVRIIQWLCRLFIWNSFVGLRHWVFVAWHLETALWFHLLEPKYPWWFYSRWYGTITRHHSDVSCTLHELKHWHKFVQEQKAAGEELCFE